MTLFPGPRVARLLSLPLVSAEAFHDPMSCSLCLLTLFMPILILHMVLATLLYFLGFVYLFLFYFEFP